MRMSDRIVINESVVGHAKGYFTNRSAGISMLTVLATTENSRGGTCSC